MLGLLSLLIATAHGSAPPATGLWVDRHVYRGALATGDSPLFGWTVPAPFDQAAFRLQVARSAALVWDSGVVQSSISDGVPFSGAAGLTGANEHAFRVQLTLTDSNRTTVADWSPWRSFFTFPSAVGNETRGAADQWGGARAIWTLNSSAPFVLLRKTVALPPRQNVYLAISAKPTPLRWGHPTGITASKLLGGYTLRVNGRALGTGPGRSVGGGLNVDMYNLTDLVGSTGGGGAASNELRLEIEAFYGTAELEKLCQPAGPFPAGGDPQDRGGVLSALFGADGSVLMATGDGSGGSNSGGWLAFDATRAMNPQKNFDSHADAGRGGEHGDYWAPAEFWDTRHLPSVPFAASEWEAAVPRAAAGPFEHARLVRKPAAPIALRRQPAARFLSSPKNATIVDLGANLQGGLTVNLTNPLAVATSVEVRLGEELTADGHTMCCPARSGNAYLMVWTLAPGATATVRMHEYAVFRYAEFRSLPAPLALGDVEAWVVRYPFDGDLNEEAEPSDGARVAAHAVTSFSSGDADLQRVWELSAATIEGASLDVNTDSNTRQRDVCTWDAWLATIEQGAVSPAGAAPLRHRAIQFMFDPQSFVNIWTEFEVAHVFALQAYGFDYGDYGASSLVRERFDGVRNYSSVAFVQEDGLAHGTPKPIIDWPRSDLIDIDASHAKMCNDACAPMNTHVATAVASLAEMAHYLGLAADAANYSATARGVAAAMGGAFAAAGEACDPPSPACFLDNPVQPPVGGSGGGGSGGEVAPGSTVQSSLFPLSLPAQLLAKLREAAVPGFGAAGAANASLLSVLPFLKARNARKGRVAQASPWAIGFMLKGLYQLALGADGAAWPNASAALDAATYAHEVLTADGENSWLRMIDAYGASMTMEAWSAEAGSGTMSHPWNAAPAYIIPHFTMGVRALAPAFRHVLIAPMPSLALAAAGAALRVPTLRGEIGASFAWSPGASGGGAGDGTSFKLEFELPGNTAARVCAPAYLFSLPTSVRLTLDGAPVLRANTAWDGGCLCVANDVKSGRHILVALT
jgi:hypothetical protein